MREKLNRSVALLAHLFEPEAVWIRPLPFTVVYTFSLIPPLLRGEPWSSYLGGFILTILVQVLAFVVPWRMIAPVWQSMLPVAQMIAVILLELTPTGDKIWPMASLILLPVITLASEPGETGLLWAIVGSVAAMEVAVLLAPSQELDATLNRAVVVPMAAVLIALGVHGTTMRLRTMREILAREHVELAQAHRERKNELTQVQHTRDELEGLTSELRATNGVLVELIDAARTYAFVATDDIGTITIFSDGAEHLFGVSQTQALGTSVLDLFDPQVVMDELHDAGLDWSLPNRRTLIFGSALAAGTHIQEWSFRTVEGKTFPVQLVVTRRPALLDGGPGGFLMIASDITNWRGSDRQQDEFVGLVSHELRTPLTGLLGYVELMLLDDELLERQRADLLIVERNGRRLLRLVDDLLLNVQLSAGSFTLELEQVELGALVTASAELLRSAAEKAGVRLIVEVADAVPLVADPVRVTQVVENLVGNALKFTPKGGTVRLQAMPDADPQAPGGIIRVTDTGIGIDSTEFARLTERFYRGRTARGRRIPGIGLGLLVTQAIVDAHGGRMDLQSEVGVGTTFEVYLPAGVSPENPLGLLTQY